jgi:hypothetical protein
VVFRHSGQDRKFIALRLCVTLRPLPEGTGDPGDRESAPAHRLAIRPHASDLLSGFGNKALPLAAHIPGRAASSCAELAPMLQAELCRRHSSPSHHRLRTPCATRPRSRLRDAIALRAVVQMTLTINARFVGEKALRTATPQMHPKLSRSQAAGKTVLKFRSNGTQPADIRGGRESARGTVLPGLLAGGH